MAMIAQASLFSWEIVEDSPDIIRFRRVIEVLPDAELLASLRAERKKRRDDYPLEATWNSILAGVVFAHPSVAALRRELRRNGELREVCGFDPLRGAKAVAPAWVYSRLLRKLLKRAHLFEAMFAALVKRVAELLPDFGVDLAIDGKALPTLGRNDADADWGMKTYRHQRKDGSMYETVKKWFGYRLHLIVDSKYELPVGYELTKASEAESPKLLPMVKQIKRRHPRILKRAKRLSADKGYDSAGNKEELYDEYGIAPLIDTRDCWTRTGQAMRPLDESAHDTIYLSPTGGVFCRVDPFTADPEREFAAMQFMGFEQERASLKFRCPAAAYSVACKNREACAGSWKAKHGDYGRVVRAPLARERRLLLPIHRHSRGFTEGYKKRTAVERVNGRIDQVYGFERHFIRGIRKMRLRVDLAMIVMLATAVGWIEAGQIENARRLLTAA